MSLHSTSIAAAAFGQKLAESNLAAAAASFDFQSIPGDFSHLLVLMHARTSISGTQEGVVIRFNNDSGTNYYYERGKFSGNAAAGEEGIGTGSPEVGVMPGNTSPSNHYGAMAIIITNYASTAVTKAAVHLGICALAFSTGNIASRAGGMIWNSTAAINRVTFTPSAGNNFMANSRCSLYGLF